MRFFFLLAFVSVIGLGFGFGQSNFSLKVSKVSETKMKVEWQNPYGDSVIQLNVQRSWQIDKNFRTVFSPLSPELPKNGYIDEAGGYPGLYYRIFYVKSDGSFFFTKARKVTMGSDLTDEISEEQKADTNFLITVHDDDTIIAQLGYKAFKKFQDSILNYTRDTLFSLTEADVLLRYFNNEVNWVPSIHVFTNNEGYVQIFLADAQQKNYRLRVFDEGHKQLFNIQHIKEAELLLDKTNFVHSGWFYFELYENDKLREKNKFYVPKDF